MEKNSSDDLLRSLARNVKAVIFDGDGVVFSGQVLVGPSGEAFKFRSHIDGQGISLLRDAGFHVALITAEKTGFAYAFIEKMNGLKSAKEGKWSPMEIITNVIGEDKVKAAGDWLEKNHLSWDECAYMGDDIGDYAVMERVAFRACPAGSEEVIKSFSHFVSEREGGKGAVRDLCNIILHAKGISPRSLTLR